jgi:AcrR family transcriptional regulator
MKRATKTAVRKSAKPRVGRPRRTHQENGGDPREDILAAAARLFETKGFAASTTRQIAASSGLQQGSVYHYFNSKDDMLANLLDRTLEPALAFAGWLDPQDAPPEEKVYLLAFQDTANMCAGPHNLAALMRLPEVSTDRFRPYWRKREELMDAYRIYVNSGFDSQVFGGIDARHASEFVFALVESSIDWFRRGSDDPRDRARLTALAVLRLLLADPSQANNVAVRAQAVLARRNGLVPEGVC